MRNPRGESNIEPKPAPSFTAIERINRSEQVRLQLEAAIGHGDYAPGERLPSERELGRMFGVSRVSVREAVSALEAIGLVDVQQGRGCFVAAPPPDAVAGSMRGWLKVHRDEIRDLLEVRGALDELAAEAAARRATPRDIRAIARAQRSFAAAAKDPGVAAETLEGLDIRFHESVAIAAGNPLLQDLLHSLNHHLSTSRRAVLAVGIRRRRAAAEHDRIVEAVRNRRPTQARARARAHLVAAHRVLDNLLRQSEG